MAAERKTIRVEDLGEPVQKLLRAMRGSLSDDDMQLLEYVGVKDMAKIYQEMSTDRRAQEIWEELKASLVARREKAERKLRDLAERENDIAAQQRQAEEDARRLREEEEQRLADEAAAAEKRRRKEEKRRLKMEGQQADEEARAAEEAARAEEEARLAEEAAERERRDAKRKRREDKARRLQEEADRLRLEQEEAANERRKARAGQKKEWDDYVAAHPLEFTKDAPREIAQVKVERTSKPPPSATATLLSRSYTPQCPNCQAKYAKAPNEWDCPMCLRKFRQRIKTWQPDEGSDNCMVCQTGVGRFSRHHCRNCGRVVCGGCSQAKAVIPGLGFKDPVKICTDCATQLAGPPPAAAAATGTVA